MRHLIKENKLSRSRAQRKALIKSLVRNLLIYERIKTTPRKAKAASAKAERLIAMAKRNDLHSRRIAFSFLQDHNLVTRLFDEIAPRFKSNPGGCTRIIDLGFRKGDGAEISILELTTLVEKQHQRKEKKAAKEHPQEAHVPSLKEAPKKSAPSKKGLRQSLRKIFKKERDAL
ncbi:MAG: 50S ribosomal protein L17 [Candidatus Omnitrophica bacterium]|nr:50S ribosomal protein L17 [Candidatus Omnitrophota bacterium]